MRVWAIHNGSTRQDGTEAAARRSARTALVLSFSVLGMAVAYFGGLYLFVH